MTGLVSGREVQYIVTVMFLIMVLSVLSHTRVPLLSFYPLGVYPVFIQLKLYSDLAIL